MWRKAGLLRDAEGLRSAAEELAEIGQGLPAGFGRPAIELRNLHTIATRIVQAALGREESRGAHFRNDFPQRDDLHYRKHSIIREGQLVFRDLIPAAGQEALAGPAAKHLPR
jgi:L-aspartate oxidase